MRSPTLMTRAQRRLTKWLRGDPWPGTTIDPGAEVDARGGHIEIGRGSHVEALAVVATEGGGSICLGTFCEIHRGALLLTHGGFIKMGDHCSVNPYAILYGHGGLTIGSDVRIAAHTVIVPANHAFDDRSRPIRQQPLSMQGVTIEDDVWLGAGVRVLDGVVIGRGAVVAAGAVVTKSVPAYTVNAGVPCRVIRERGTATPPAMTGAHASRPEPGGMSS